MTKIIALYLPQFHEIKENNEWWGKGHTEWISCKAAKPLFNSHKQPKVPLNNNYYNLLDTKVQEWQSQLALENGIDGFCYYHYWFEGKKLLEKPAENMLQNKNIKIPFMFSWANHTWIGSVQRKKKVLIKQTYGTEKDWKDHFNYLLPFFKDNRYIKKDGKPVFVIYDLKDIELWNEMYELWDSLAKENGFRGIYIISTLKMELDNKLTEEKIHQGSFFYQPRYVTNKSHLFTYQTYYYYKFMINKNYLNRLTISNYRRNWRNIIRISKKNLDSNIFLGAFTNWDTTARWGRLGEVMKQDKTNYFQKYFSVLYDISVKNNKDYLFITAWNEWSEGAYLEPDTENKYTYLKIIKHVKEGL